MNENYTTPPQGNFPPARRSFFDTLRTSRYLRAEPRVIGGVLSGLSLRFGWDTTLLRILAVIATLFFPLTAAAYALAWFFLPEQRDGRIHAEALTLGYFDIAQLGALFLFLLGVGNSGLYFIGLGGFFWPMLAIGVMLFIYFIFESSKRTPHPGNIPPASPAPGTAPTTPFASANAFAPATAPTSNEASDWRTQGGPAASTYGTQGFEGPAQQPTFSHPSAGQPFYEQPAFTQATYAAPPQQVPYFTQVPIQRPRTVPLWANLLVTGLITLVFAAVFAFMLLPETRASNADQGMAILVGGGICLLLVAIPMAIAALRDRSAAWLLALSIIGMMIAGPATLAANAMRYDFHMTHFPNEIESQHWKDSPPVEYSSADNYIGNVGYGIWNLADLPDGDRDSYYAENVLGTLRIFVRPGQPIEINVDDALGVIDAEYLPGSTNDWVDEHLGIASNVSIRSVSDPRMPVTRVHISSLLGTLEIVEVEDPRSSSKDDPQSAAQGVQTPEKPQSTNKPQSGGNAADQGTQSR